MKNSISVCLLALSFFVNATHEAQSQTPVLRKGVSVQMALTKNAIAYPEADRDDAWIVTITAGGRVFFGVKPVTMDELGDSMKSTPRNRDARLYIKADARAPLAALSSVLAAARVVSFDSVVLLTMQSESPALGKMVAPKGLVISPLPPSPDTVVVQLHDRGMSAPELTVNNQEIHAATLQNALNQALQGQKERSVAVNSDAQLPFAQLAQVIDACASVHAKVIVPAQD